MTLLHRHGLKAYADVSMELAFHFLAPDAAAEMQGVLLGTPPLSDARSSSIFARDYQDAYQEFAASEPAWVGGRVTGAVGSRVVYATDGGETPLPEMPYILSAPESTNYFLDSEVPAMQTIRGLSGDHTFSCIGTGSVTLTGGVSGSISDGSPLTGNPNGGNVIMSPYGSLDSVQVEPGDVVTPPIPTTTAEVTRDACALSFDSANWSETEGSVYLEADVSGTATLVDGLLDITNGFVGLTDGTYAVRAASLVEGTCQIGWVYSSTGMRLCVDGVWSEVVPYAGGMLQGIFDLFRSSAVVGGMRDIQCKDTVDEQWITDKMPTPVDYGDDFVMVVKTTAPGEEFTITCVNVGTYNAVIDWGDGTPTSLITSYDDPNLIHPYAAVGSYTIRLSGSMPHFYFLTDVPPKVVAVLQGGSIGCLSMFKMFDACSNLAVVNLADFDASMVDNFSETFDNCDILSSIDLSGLDTSAVRVFTYTFRGCSGLTTVDMSGIDTSSVQQLTQMFRYCSDLVSVDLSGFNTTALTSTLLMWDRCYNVSSESMDIFLSALYASRMLTTWATPEVDISSCNAPSGVYQDATPPTTGEEYRYKLENDPDAESFHTWTITV